MEIKNLKILLLGGGYTLSKLADKLDPKSFLITTTTKSKQENFRSRGFYSEILDIYNKKNVNNFFEKHKHFEIIIDSIPPQFNSRNPNEKDLDNALGGVKNLVSIFKNYPVRKFFYLSTTGVYGEINGSIVDENTAVNPQSIRAKARVESENLYRNLNCEVTCFRLAGIYGEGRDSLDSLRQGVYPLVNDGEAWSNRINVEDIAEILFLAIKSKNKLPSIFNMSDGTFVKIKEVVQYLCQQFQLDYPKSITIEEATKRGMHTLLGNKRVSNDLVKKFFNYQFKYSDFKSYYKKK